MAQPKYPKIGFAYSKFESQKYPIYASSWVYTSDYHDSIHRHDFPQIWYCRRGIYTHYVDDQVYECAEGSLVVIPAGVLHTFRIPEGKEAELMSVHISYELLLELQAGQYEHMVTNLFLPCFSGEMEWSFSPHTQLSPQSRETVNHCLSRIALLGYASYMPDLSHQLCQALEEMFSVSEYDIPEQVLRKKQTLLQTRILPIYRSVLYLNRHFDQKITEDAVLQAGGISRSGFYRYWGRVLGCTYSQYLQQLRVDHVYIYLKCTNYPISYIADACGFFDMQYMSQVFSRYIGESPNRRRQHLRKLYSGTFKE